MDRPPDRPWVRLVAGTVALEAVLAILAVALYVVLEPLRPVIARVAAVVMLSVALLRARRAARESVPTRSSLSIAAAVTAPAPPPAVDPFFARLEREIHASRISRRYFDHVLWPRLLALDGRLPGDRAGLAAREPEARRWLGRGPRLAALAHLIETLERRR